MGRFTRLLVLLPGLLAPPRVNAGGPAAPAAGGPASVTVRCGDVTLRIDGPKIWTLSRIEFRGTRLGIEESAYGSVFNFPEVGFVGSGHRDKGSEEARALEFRLDGRRLESPGPLLAGRSFRLAKHSRIREVDLESVVELRDDRLEETTVVRAAARVPLNFAYHFMHAWTPTATAYVAGRDDGREVAGELRDAPEVDRRFYVNAEMDWIAVYDGPSGKGAVSRLLGRPDRGGAMMKLWNVPRVYRKFYLQCFTGEPLPAGFSGTYRMVTAFFEAGPDAWPAVARDLALRLRARGSR